MFGGVQSEIARLRDLRANISTSSLASTLFTLFFFFFFFFGSVFGLVNKCLILYSILKVFFNFDISMFKSSKNTY